jgi:hypothetical protein
MGARVVVHQVAAAADACHERVGHSERRGNRHRGVNRISAATQYVQPGRRGLDIVGSHGAARPDRDRLLWHVTGRSHGRRSRKAGGNGYGDEGDGRRCCR